MLVKERIIVRLASDIAVNMFCVTFCPSKMFGDQRTSRTKCPPRALALAQRSLDPPTGACRRRTRNDAGQIHPQACIRQRSLGFNNLAGAEVWLKRPGPESYFHDDSIGRSDPEVVSARKRRVERPAVCALGWWHSTQSTRLLSLSRRKLLALFCCCPPRSVAGDRPNLVAQVLR